MLACTSCGKSKQMISYSRHKKGSSGGGGNWSLRAPIHQKIQKPNLHSFKGNRYCTKCLRKIKVSFVANRPGITPTAAI